MLSAVQQKIQRKWKKSGIQIDRELRDIIHGYIVADGYVSGEGSLLVAHSIKQKKFVEWLYTKLYKLRTNTPIRINKRIDQRSNTSFWIMAFQTRRFLKGFRHMWYKPVNLKRDKWKKQLPDSLDCFFTIPFITLWFAGDGTKMIGQRGAKFEVTAFSVEERQRLKHLFKKKFDISAKINRAGKSKIGTSQWTLSIPAGEYEKFRELITQMDLIPTIFPNKLCKKIN